MSKMGSRTQEEITSTKSLKVDLKNNIVSPKNIVVEIPDASDKKFSTITENHLLEK